MSDLDTLTEKVEDMRAVVQGTPPGERRRKMNTALLKRAADLDAACKEYAQKLHAQWIWLDANEGHPDFERRESMLIKNIHRYSAIGGVLVSALDDMRRADNQP